MEIDSGSAISAISETCFNQNFTNLPLLSTNLRLRSYANGKIVPKGLVWVRVKHGEKLVRLPLYVIQNGGPPLLGRDWYSALNFVVPMSSSLNNIGISNPSMDSIWNKFEGLNEGIGTFNKGNFRLHLKPNARPVFCHSRVLAFALKSKVDKEIDELVEKKIIYRVDFSEWATPIVPIVKSNGKIRICGDFKVTVNPQLEVERYPLPRVEEIFCLLQGGEKFSTIDLSHAYQQLLLDKDSQALCTINTHRGLFRYSRLPFGIASAPAIFQRAMDQTLQGLKGVACFQDDLIITGENDEIHLANLEAILKRLYDSGFKVNKDKCKLMQDSVDYLGHTIDKHGLHASNCKVAAICDSPIPSNVAQLRAFLGLVEYYAKFLPNLASKLAPLHKLLQKDTKWLWTKECNTALKGMKDCIRSATVLAHYDPSLPLILECDASPQGLGAVIVHRYVDGEERPIAFASRSLNKTERNYSQIDREALGIMFGVKNLHQYLYGREFTLRTDHKPLTFIFGEKKGIPQMAANRIQRWAVTLQGYNYKIEHVKAVQNKMADGLSRLPLSMEEPEENEISFIVAGESEFLPVTAEEIRKETKRDVLLSKVLDFCMFGWPSSVEVEFKPFESRKLELTLEQGCLFWGNRVVIPLNLRKNILDELHSSHLGISKMKSVARSFVWWPNLDEDIERMAKNCVSCAMNKPAPSKAPVKPWNRPDRAWQRLHIALAGPFLNKLFLVVLDSFSKWPEVFEIKNGGVQEILKHLRALFATFGLPEIIVSDNGSSFISQEFQLFCKMNGKEHIRSAPYHPQTNGAAENLVKEFKIKIKTLLCSGIPLNIALPRFLFTS